MKRADLIELQFIAPIGNLASIAELGLLSHNIAAEVPHVDVSDETIQDLRRGKEVPNSNGVGRELHDFANVYICARNPMMYIRRHRHTELAVLCISCDVLDLEGAVIADGNASSKYTRFLASPMGLEAINKEITFLGDPTHADQIEYWRRKREQCAEVLVPDVIAPEYVTGAYVSGSLGLSSFQALQLPWAVEIDEHMFYQEP